MHLRPLLLLFRWNKELLARGIRRFRKICFGCSRCFLAVRACRAHSRIVLSGLILFCNTMSALDLRDAVLTWMRNLCEIK